MVRPTHGGHYGYIYTVGTSTVGNVGNMHCGKYWKAQSVYIGNMHSGQIGNILYLYIVYAPVADLNFRQPDTLFNRSRKFFAIGKVQVCLHTISKGYKVFVHLITMGYLKSVR
jgi:hypothetical protein